MIFWIILIIIFLPVLILLFNGLFVMPAPRYKGPVSDHFNGKIFFNPHGRPAKGIADVFKWLVTRKRNKWIIRQNIRKIVPVKSFNSTGFKITFVNHSTFLIQVAGLNILTDPIFKERVSPYSFAGPKRELAPGIDFTDLPKIDFILLSHNHYDHCEIETLKTLAKDSKCKIFTTLGVDLFLQKNGIENCKAMDWWDKSNFQAIEITCVPAYHFSGRGITDRDATLWAGFVHFILPVTAVMAHILRRSGKK
jgi:hypothetical protein